MRYAANGYFVPPPVVKIVPGEHLALCMPDLGDHTMMRWRLLACVALALLISGSPSPRAVAATPQAPTMPRLVQQRAVELPDTRIISMSPDGRWIAGVQPALGYQRGQLCTFATETLAPQACADLSPLEAGLRIEDVVWSPDGTRLAFAEETFKVFLDGDLWVMDAVTGRLTNVDDDGFSGRRLPVLGDAHDGVISLPVNPAFSPDGRRLAFSRSLIVNGVFAGNVIATVPADGSAAPEIVTRVTAEEPGVVYFGIRWAPDARRIFYSVHHRESADPQNGIWSVDMVSGQTHQVLGVTDPDAGAPAVAHVAASGDRLLAFYPLAAARFQVAKPVFALVDLARGRASWLTLNIPGVPDYAWVWMATFSPDGRMLLLVSRLTDPDHQVILQDVSTGRQVSIVPEGLTGAGPVAWGILPTWATNGTVFITNGASLSSATLLELG